MSAVPVCAAAEGDAEAIRATDRRGIEDRIAALETDPRLPASPSAPCERLRWS